MSRRTKSVGELALVELIRRQTIHKKGLVRVGIGDDCAVLAPRRGEEIVVTTDFCLEERHFKRAWHRPNSVGWRCLARGLSDVAAMGAQPVAAFLSLALPPEVAADTRWVKGFLAGLQELAGRFGVQLAGGDTAESPSGLVLADIILLGAVKRGKALLRSGARAGDGIYVTGAVGGAAVELKALGAAPARFRRARPNGKHPHLFPEPRIAVGRELVRRGLASACIDVSDGLSTDLAHLCAESKVRAEVNASQLPLHSNGADREMALHGGEDYELLFTVPASKRVPSLLAGVPVTRIGSIVRAGKGQMMTLIEEDGRRAELEARGFEHFKSSKSSKVQR